MSTTPTKTEAATAPAGSIEESLELAKRAFALQKYEQAVDHYATALELMTEKHGEDAPEMADMYFQYGKALLENAIAQSSVLGKEQAEDAVLAAVEDAKPEAGGSGKFLSFSGDADDDDAVDLFAEATKVADEADADAEGEEEEEDAEGEPEDDFNAAWEVLDLARAIYEKQQDEDDAVKLKLADTYIALGDVSLETEKFDQAITDYTAGLKLKNELLPLSSRQIAEAHYKLSIVLDLTSGRLGDAISHASLALDSVEARLAELRDALNGQGGMVADQSDDKKDVKGKGKAKGARLLGPDSIQKMTKTQMEAEVKDLRDLREDLALKVDELKAAPEQPLGSATEMVAKALDSELNASSAGAASAPTAVNDLTGIVKKKKKNADANGAPKRKAEEEVAGPPSDKKARVEETS
ncbi:hypothetical protein CERSUDRAFT_112558 [Gelatoporia subvermispora B]|uniref:Tetratricopeptide SHNi-TPR domain-containing protein n=1 Tax=Ceriporiopsis subvermispora (strain B) TaxID=914234 RepID=M2QP35_CERS8|nr:hypothetical protein CERSUDRAFT_112558 [Gelatoporia subvermispora B]